MNLVTNESVPSSSSSMFKQQVSGNKSLTDDAENEESCDMIFLKFHRHLTQVRGKTRKGPIIASSILFIAL